MANILVVDDDPQVRRLMTDALADRGYRVAEAASVEEALSFRGPWDLLVLDLRLPDGDAADVAQHYPGVPVITVSGAIGATLQKPFSMRELVSRVRFSLGE